MKEQRILCIGNGGYYNRGCEAIVRGTMVILRRTFGAGVVADAGCYGSPEEIGDQFKTETDPGVRGFHQRDRPGKWTKDWLAMQSNRMFGTNFSGHRRCLSERLDAAAATLILGGDTYSLDYGRPINYLADDDFVMRRGAPLILWGASVGPFTTDPEFEPVMANHLLRLDGVFVRESKSESYLESLGIKDNLYVVADPAFLMDPVEVDCAKAGLNLQRGAIGLNFSPLMARYIAGEDGEPWNISASAIEQWAQICAQLVVQVSRATERPIVLVPHVIHPSASLDDAVFLQTVARKARASGVLDIQCVPQSLNAQELKWVISQFHVFAGARTHSTIASLSSLVPTVSIGYSVKAAGINQDLFGHTDWVEDVKQFDPGSFCEKIDRLLVQRDQVHEQLRLVIPGVREKAHMAGTYLRGIIDGRR